MAPENTLNIAAICPATSALGPGLRAALWVQGCNAHCSGCIAPEWISHKSARRVLVEEILPELLLNPQVTGLTFSGGEPMLQAAGLAKLAWLARQTRELDIICFTGYRLEQLLQSPPSPGVTDLLEQIDLLIDGPYLEEFNDNQGLRGSSNQRIHFLTSRLAGINFESSPRQTEIQILNGSAVLVGVPAQGVAQAFETAVRRAKQMALAGGLL
jgi:anaerobic ribonucleoside-triphosphate reductase activating protein